MEKLGQNLLSKKKDDQLPEFIAPEVCPVLDNAVFYKGVC
jgi:hypothetical protein